MKPNLPAVVLSFSVDEHPEREINKRADGHGICFSISYPVRNSALCPPQDASLAVRSLRTGGSSCECEQNRPTIPFTSAPLPRKLYNLIK